MSKSVYEFWLSIDNGAEKLRLPVLPATLGVSYPSKNDSIDIAKLGEVTIIQDSTVRTFNLSSYFPVNETPLTEYSRFPEPWECIKTIERWKKSGKPIRFIVTGTPVNYAVSIEDFTYREGESDIGEIDYSLSLKEYRFVTARKVDVSKPVPSQPRPNPQPVPHVYNVKKGDTLIAIARKFYNDSSKWKELWEANKAGLIERDKRNLKQPGHWIHIDYKLVIPA